MKIIALVFALAHPQVADTSSYADLVATVLERLELPSRLDSRPIHLDLSAAVDALNDHSSGVYSKTAADQERSELLSRLRNLSGFGERLQAASSQDVLSCETSPDDWRRCSVVNGGVAVSIPEVGKVQGSKEIRVVLRARWAGEDRRLLGYDMELFLGRIVQPGTRTHWEVVRMGVVIVL